MNIDKCEQANNANERFIIKYIIIETRVESPFKYSNDI